MKINRKYCLSGLLFAVAFLFSSCQKINSGSDENYAIVTLSTSGTADTTYTTFTFELPPNDGSGDIYAVRTTSAESVSERAYAVSAVSASDVPFDAFYLKLVPAHTDSSGKTVGPTAVVRVTTYSASTSTNPIDENYYPKSRTFNISSVNGLSSENYYASAGADGKFEFNWSADSENEVKTNETYTEYAYKSYSLASVKVVATIK